MPPRIPTPSLRHQATPQCSLHRITFTSQPLTSQQFFHSTPRTWADDQTPSSPPRRQPQPSSSSNKPLNLSGFAADPTKSAPRLVIRREGVPGRDSRSVPSATFGARGGAQRGGARGGYVARGGQSDRGGRGNFRGGRGGRGAPRGRGGSGTRPPKSNFRKRQLTQSEADTVNDELKETQYEEESKNRAEEKYLAETSEYVPKVPDLAPFEPGTSIGDRGAAAVLRNYMERVTPFGQERFPTRPWDLLRAFKNGNLVKFDSDEEKEHVLKTLGGNAGLMSKFKALPDEETNKVTDLLIRGVYPHPGQTGESGTLETVRRYARNNVSYPTEKEASLAREIQKLLPVERKRPVASVGGASSAKSSVGDVPGVDAVKLVKKKVDPAVA